MIEFMGVIVGTVSIGAAVYYATLGLARLYYREPIKWDAAHDEPHGDVPNTRRR